MRAPLEPHAVIKLLSFCVEYSIVIFFFSPISQREIGKRWPGYLCLAGIVCLYLFPLSAFDTPMDYSAGSFFELIIRFTVYWIAVMCYLHFTKEKTLPACMYLALFYMPFYNTARGLSAMLRYVRLITPAFMADLVFHQYWMSIAVLALEFLAAFLVHRFIRLEQIQEIRIDRIALTLMVNFLVLYFKYSTSSLQREENYSIRFGDAVFYPLCAMLGLLTFLILFESLQLERENLRALELERLAQGYEMQNAKRTLQVQEDIRRLHHDMKNHLLAIRDLERDKGEASAYVDALLGDMADYEDSVSTGLPAMDAFLSEKVYRARLEHIDCDVCLDLSPLGFVSQVDLISIFGNAVDNALEAVRKLPEGDRAIFLKSSRFANTVLLRFSNPYAGEIRRGNGRLLTGKDDPTMHGIGLGSIEKAAAHYQGNVDIQVDEAARQFSLVVMIPIPE